ncbi:MAG: gamma-glutamyltransferase, partial [Nitrosopumilaceae archaeon]|nr:gamma-glutamyltransferase [Nitrosopumilaceae archaeon]
QSIELVYGSKAAADGLGFLYNNYMSAFEFENPSHPFYLRPNSIPWTSVSPSIIFYNHEPWIVLGSPGSARIFSVVSHFISRVIDGSNSMDIAMTRPRIHCSLDGKISIEADDSGVEIIRHLKKMGYKIDIRERFSFYLGAIHAVLKRQTGDGFQGIAEMRRDGTAEGLN